MILETKYYVEVELLDKPTVRLEGNLLPESHQMREAIADALCEDYYVKVERFGTGNGKHSGFLPGCGVRWIDVRAKTPLSDEIG